MRAVVPLIVLATASCNHLAHLEPAHPTKEPEARADLVVGDIIDKRGDTEIIGSSTETLLGVSYDIETDRPLGPWLATHVRTALRETGLAHTASAPSIGGSHQGELSVAVVKFELSGGTWIKAVAVFDVALYNRSRDLVAAKRITVQTTDLATDNGDIAWSQRADRLARWSAIEIARWASDRMPP